MIRHENTHGKVPIRFLMQLIKDPKRKVFPALDTLYVHQCRKAPDWLEEKGEKGEKAEPLFFAGLHPGA